jgi:hypothetical protein
LISTARYRSCGGTTSVAIPELAAHRYRAREETGYAIVLLGATALRGAIEFVLQRPLRQVGLAEVGDADQWRAVVSFPADQTHQVVQMPVPGGGAVRVRAGDDVSNTVFVLDPESRSARPGCPRGPRADQRGRRLR